MTTRREKGGKHGSLWRSFQVKDKRKVAGAGSCQRGGVGRAALLCSFICFICLLLEGGHVSQCAEREGQLLQVK